MYISFQNEEFYICILSHRYGDTILFHHEGGIDIGDVDAKVGVKNIMDLACIQRDRNMMCHS